MKSRLFLIIAAAGVLIAGLASAESALTPFKLQTLVRVKAKSGDQTLPVSPGLTRDAAATPLYYVSALETDANGMAIPGAISLAPLQMGSMTLGYGWPLAPADSGLVPVRLGFASKGDLGFAFPRFAVNEALVAVSTGAVTVKSNSNTGGAVWEWSAMGKQFIDDYDYGRQLSMAIYTAEGRSLQETGDNYGGANLPLYARHPTPTSYLRNSVDHQSSRAVPLEWAPDAWHGGKDNPVLYKNALIGKELTLDWRGPDHVDRNWPVSLYESIYEGPALGVAVVEAPTAYLTAEFNHYYKYDPKSDAVSALSLYHAKANLSGGEASGVIIASGEGPDAIAMGIYVSDPNAGIVLYDNSGPDGGHYGSSFSKWSVIYRSQVGSVWKFRTWIVTDSVRNIQEDFHQLYLWGVTSRDLNSPGK